jgi:hypothetical protein
VSQHQLEQQQLKKLISLENERLEKEENIPERKTMHNHSTHCKKEKRFTLKLFKIS